MDAIATKPLSTRRKCIAVPDYVELPSHAQLLIAAGLPSDANLIREAFIWNQMYRVFMYEHDSFPEIKDTVGIVEHIALNDKLERKW